MNSNPVWKEDYEQWIQTFDVRHYNQFRFTRSNREKKVKTLVPGISTKCHDISQEPNARLAETKEIVVRWWDSELNFLFFFLMQLIRGKNRSKATMKGKGFSSWIRWKFLTWMPRLTSFFLSAFIFVSCSLFLALFFSCSLLFQSLSYFIIFSYSFSLTLNVPLSAYPSIHLFFFISTSFISTPSLRYWGKLSTLLCTL